MKKDLTIATKSSPMIGKTFLKAVGNPLGRSALLHSIENLVFLISCAETSFSILTQILSGISP
jgi:hypothetical protein